MFKTFSKRVPKKTVLSADGYLYDKRRNDNRTIVRHNQNVDNRFIVPYCPVLLYIFNCHINVEVVSSVKSVKYLYKYVYKGYDAANITIEENDNDRVINHDKIRSYSIETRYVSPVEACYFILSKPLQGKSHSIVRLPVHLPNQQSIVIDDINDDTAVSYAEIPADYVFKQCNANGNKVHKWFKRKSHLNCIRRMYSVSPSKIELF